MDVIDCIETRRSIRKFLDVPVDWDKIAAVLDAARLAPSAGNLQNWKFVVVLEKEARAGITEAALQQGWMLHAPVHIIVLAEPETGKRFYGIRGERLYTTQNCAAAVENMLLAAHSLGLGACWIGAFDEEMVKRVIKCPDEIRPQAIVVMGYPDEKPPKPQKFSIEKVVYLEKYWGRHKDLDASLGYTSKKVEAAVKKGKEILEKIDKKLKKKG